MTATPVRLALAELLGMTAMALCVLPAPLAAQAPELLQRQARIDRAIAMTEQVVRQLDAQLQGQRSQPVAASRSPCLVSEAAWLDCLQDIEGATALVSDSTRARRIQRQLPYANGLHGRLSKGDLGGDLALMREILAGLKGEKQQLLERMDRPSRPGRPPA